MGLGSSDGQITIGSDRVASALAVNSKAGVPSILRMADSSQVFRDIYIRDDGILYVKSSDIAATGAGWPLGGDTVAGAYFPETLFTLHETNLAGAYAPIWWLNSGAYMLFDGAGGAATVQGVLGVDTPDLDTTAPTGSWHGAYLAANPSDTDNGDHPQNIFRAVTRANIGATQELWLTLNKYNVSASANRDGTNGIHLIGRYQDDDNLYVCGIRTDGNITCKKKRAGTYTTFTTSLGAANNDKQHYSGTYDINNNPNLLPIGRRIGIRFSCLTVGPNVLLTFRLYDPILTGVDDWKLIMSITDNGSEGGAVWPVGKAEIRSDFFDTTFHSYRTS